MHQYWRSELLNLETATDNLLWPLGYLSKRYLEKMRKLQPVCAAETDYLQQQPFTGETLMATFNLRTMATSVACASFALLGLVTPALAQDHSVFLQEDESEKFTAFFLEGETISAICDEDCSDVDLYLYTELGVLVDSDTEVDAYPVLMAPFDGTFSVEVSMPDCSYAAGCSADISSEYGFEVL